MCNYALLLSGVSHSSPLEHAWAHVHTQTINILQLDQRSPKAPSVKADHNRTRSWSRRLNPKAPSALGASQPISSRKFHTGSLRFPPRDERRRASASSWSLCLVWHVCRNSRPLSSALTATLVTTGTERLPRHSSVSSGSSITSHLSQDYSPDLLLPLKRMNAIRTKGCRELQFISDVANLLVFLMSARIFVSFVLTLLAKMGINRTRRNSFILKMVIWWLWCDSA